MITNDEVYEKENYLRMYWHERLILKEFGVILKRKHKSKHIAKAITRIYIEEVVRKDFCRIVRDLGLEMED